MNIGNKDFPLAHLAIAVESLAAAAPLYSALGFQLHAPEVIARECVRAQLATKGEFRIELLEAHPAGSGPIAKFIEKRGPGLHHIAVRLEHLDQDLAALAAVGVQLLPGYPATGMGGTRVAFVHPKTAGGVLIELVAAQ
jgi:methylmalonyl-CoA epimerase